MFKYIFQIKHTTVTFKYFNKARTNMFKSIFQIKLMTIIFNYFNRTRDYYPLSSNQAHDYYMQVLW